MAGEGAQGRTHWRGLPRLGSGLLGGGAGATPWAAQKLPCLLRLEEPSHWAIRKPPQGPRCGAECGVPPQEGPGAWGSIFHVITFKENFLYLLNFCIETDEKKSRLYLSTNEEFMTKLY